MDNVRKQFRDWLDNGIMPPANLRAVIYQRGMEEEGAEEEWDKVWNKYLVETNPSEKNLLLAALTSVRQSHIIQRLLQFAQEEKGIRRQDFFTVLNYLGRNHNAVHVVWDWMRTNYEALEKRFTTGDRYFGRMAYYLIRQFKTELKLGEVRNFFGKHTNRGAGARYLKMGVESIKKNINWMKTVRKDILEWVKNNNP